MSFCKWLHGVRHAPRERVSWNRYAIGKIKEYIVTLHVSVWVEMLSSLLVITGRKQSRSTWACELKYFGACQPLFLIQRHAPRERVSWNCPVCAWRRALKVTLHVSVWVEICTSAVGCSLIMSRSTWACELKSSIPIRGLTTRYRHAPRERVSWNCQHFPRKYSNACHAPRERVSWNLTNRTVLLMIAKSRSTWACELK